VLGHAVDTMSAGADDALWLSLAAGLIAVGLLCEVVGAFAGTACVAGTTAWLRNRLVRHILDAGPAVAEPFDAGDLVSRVSGNAVDAARAGPSLVAVGTAVLPPVGSLVFLAVIDVWLAVAFLIGVAAVTMVLRAFTQRTAEAVGAYLRIQGRIAARLAESLTGIRTIAAAGTVDRERARVLADLPELSVAGVNAWRVLGRSSAQGAVVGPAVLVAVLAAGGAELVAGRISPGDLFAASQYAMLGVGLGGLTGVFGGLARSRAGVERAGEVLSVPAVEYGPRDLPAGPGLLTFRSVSVHGLLADVDLALPGGSAVAVVGVSGAGKSTLAALAARLRDPDAGQILLDDVPLGELSHSALRTAVGCAFERPDLVGGTVAEAIGLGLPLSQVQSAARATRADEFIRRLPDGYDTALAEAPMSGGEAQRIGLARAWHAQRLLVLDDATSSLDMVTEMLITDALLDDHGSRTRLIVTHRAATAARADIVVWLEGGRVRGVGPHLVLEQIPDYREAFG